MKPINNKHRKEKELLKDYNLLKLQRARNEYCEAFKYEFWQGWKHCKAELPDFDDIYDEEVSG